MDDPIRWKGPLMDSRKKTGIALAGVSLIALSVTLGAMPALADDYVINTDAIDVEITNDIAGSVINNAVVGNGSNDFGIKVRNNAVVAGDLVNNDTVTAAYTASAPVASTSVAGIVVWSGGQVEGQVINNGTVSAEAGATGLLALSQAYGIVTEGDDNPDIGNSDGASVTAEASSAASDYALAIAGGLGEAGVKLEPVQGPPAPADVSIPTDAGHLSNAGSIDVSASASLLAVGEADDPGHDAIALAFGAGQLLASESVAASLTNASGADISVAASAEAKYHSNDRALAAAGGLLQIAIGGEASGMIANQGNVDVGVETYATASGDNTAGIGLAAGLGAGSFQLISGGAGSATAGMTNDGQISVAVGSRAETTGDNAALALAAGLGSVQAATGTNAATASVTNNGDISVVSGATASGMMAAAIAAGIGNLQAAVAQGSSGVTSAAMTNDGSITAHYAAKADGTIIGIAAAAGLGNLQIAAGGGDAAATFANQGDIALATDAASLGLAAVAIAGGPGTVQAALALGVESVASAAFTNDGDITVENSADASGLVLGAAIGGGVGSLQLAISGSGSAAAMTNNGTLDVAVDGTAIATAGSALAVAAARGAAQVSLSLLGAADAVLANNGTLEVESGTAAAGNTAITETVTLGALQLAGSFGFDATASLVNADAAVITAAADTEAIGVTNAKADSYVIGAGQIAISGSSAATTTLLNEGHITAAANSDGKATDATAGSVEAEADAAAIDQLALSGGGIADLSVTNQSAIDASSTVTASAAYAAAGARAQGINQYGFAENTKLNVSNSGGITVNVDGTADGIDANTNASAFGVVQAALSSNAEVGLDNAGDIVVHAKANASSSAPAPSVCLAGGPGCGAPTGSARAVAVGQMVRQPVELMISLPSDITLPALAGAQPGMPLPAGMTTGPVVAGALPVDLPGELDGGLDGVTLPDLDLPVITSPIAAATNLWLDVNNAAGAKIEALSQASAGNQASALAAGSWYENLFGSLSGGIDNAGMIMATAIASGASAEASAVGVAEISRGANSAVLNNSGAIMAYAVGPETNAIGIAVASPVSMPAAQRVAPVDAVTVINNRGGAITAIEAREENGEMLRGTAISTRGGVMTSNDILTAEAANAVDINLQGGSAGSIGKDVVVKSLLVSDPVHEALIAEQSWGYVYGNILVTSDDTINVTDGVTILDGVVNAGDDQGAGTLNVTDGGKLVMVRNDVNGASGANVAAFNINARGTLLYELSANAAPGAYAQVIAHTANVEGGKLVALYDQGLYADETVYDNVIGAETLEGAVSVTDNSPLLITDAVNDGEDGIDLRVRRVAFNQVAGLTSNEQAAGGAIEKVYGKLTERTDFGRMVSNMFLLDRSEYKDVLAQLSGAEYAQHLQSVLWSTRAVNNIISERMECSDGAAYVKTSNAAKVGGNAIVPTADAPMASSGCHAQGQASVWARGFGQWNSLDGDSNAPGYDEDQYGFMFGADYAFHESLFLGVAGGYFNSAGNFDGWGGRQGAAINYDGLQLAAYGGYDNSVYYLRGVVSYGNYAGDSKRDFNYRGAAPVQLTGDPTSDTWAFYGETGYRFALSELGSLTPFAGLSIATASLDGFTEDQSLGSDAALEIHDSSANSVASVLGVRFEADVPMGSGVFTPAVSVSWMHEFGQTAQEVDMSFAGAPAGADFTAKGSEVARDSVLLGAGAKFGFTDAIDFGVFYNGQFNTDYTSNAVTARLGYKF